MKKYIRFDSVGGASGDMILSALAAVGADLTAIEKTINAFFPDPVHFHTDAAQDSGLTGTRVSVLAHHTHAHEDEWPDAHAPDTGHSGHAHAHRGFAEIERLLSNAALPDTVRAQSLEVFRTLASVEAKIHGKTPETVHFHEIGAWDSVADIVGGCLALEQLGVSGVACGPLPSGTGTLRCAHGEMPNPAPATQELLAGMTVVQTDEPFELVTPTGAALLSVWVRAMPPPPKTAVVNRTGFGFGGRTLNGRPNVLRATLLTEVPAVSSETEEHLIVLEANLDDCNPEWLGALAAELLKSGALDVWQTPILMKKSRSGTLFSVLTKAANAASLREHIFRATTTFGIRYYKVQRQTLARRFETAHTPWGDVPVKIGTLKGTDITVSPEHDACAEIATQNALAPRQVYDAAKKSIPV